MPSQLIELIFDGDNEKVANLLDKDKELSISSYDGKSALYWACLLGMCDIVETLLRSGADPNDTDSDGESPLHVAASSEDINCINSLLSYDAIVDQATNEGITPLMIAAKEGSVKMVKQLLDAGANPMALDLSKRNVLHWSALGEHDDSDLIALLLENGADPLVKNLNGKLPLEYAKTLNKINIYNALKVGNEKIGYSPE